MGMGAEMLDDLWIAWSSAEDRIQELFDKKTWVTADGTKIKIKHMSDHHISNCLAHLERGDWPWRADYIELFQKEQVKRIKRDFNV